MISNENVYSDDIVPEISNIYESYKPEAKRLETFYDWDTENPVTKEDLARNGFIYTHVKDRTQCAFCRCVLSNWKNGDTVADEHKSYCPECPFAFGYECGNIPLKRSDSSSNRLSRVEFNSPTAFPTTREPKYEEWGDEYKRIRSFKGWPIRMAQTPRDLAAAGLLYTGIGDRCKCFWCGGELYDWNPRDKPWEEHAKLFPYCGYVKAMKTRGES